MDKNMLGDLDNLPEEDKLKMAAMIDQLQIRDSLRMYNALVERCFNDCVDTFKHKSLQKQEESCVRRCAEKFFEALHACWHEVCRTQSRSSHTRLRTVIS